MGSVHIKNRIKTRDKRKIKVAQCVIIKLINVIKMLEYCLDSKLTSQQDIGNILSCSISSLCFFWGKRIAYLISCAGAISLTLFTTLEPQTALMTQVILLSEFIYTVEALMTWIWWLFPFVLQWNGKSVEQDTYDLTIPHYTAALKRSLLFVYYKHS